MRKTVFLYSSIVKRDSTPQVTEWKGVSREALWSARTWPRFPPGLPFVIGELGLPVLRGNGRAVTSEMVYQALEASEEAAG